MRRVTPILLIAWIGVAGAEPVPVEQQARRHYDEGRKAFDLGEFARAIREFKAAYEIKTDPVLLYNIAQAYRLTNDLGQAIFFYKSYLRTQPRALNRKEVEARLARLEEEQAKAHALAVEPPTDTAEPPTMPRQSPPPREAATPAPESVPLVQAAAPEPERRPTRSWVWATIGVAAALVVGALIAVIVVETGTNYTDAGRQSCGMGCVLLDAMGGGMGARR